MDSIGIGTLAKRAGVSIDTVRYYERGGLLAPKTRLASGYRRYTELEVAAPALHPSRPGPGLFAEAGEGAAGALEAARRRARGAARRRKSWRMSKSGSPRSSAYGRGSRASIAACPGHGRAADCPILEALGDEELS